jgi:hypothetical protein
MGRGCLEGRRFYGQVGACGPSEAGPLIETDGFHLHSIFIKENKSND